MCRHRALTRLLAIARCARLRFLRARTCARDNRERLFAFGHTRDDAEHARACECRVSHITTSSVIVDARVQCQRTRFYALAAAAAACDAFIVWCVRTKPVSDRGETACARRKNHAHAQFNSCVISISASFGRIVAGAHVRVFAVRECLRACVPVCLCVCVCVYA